MVPKVVDWCQTFRAKYPYIKIVDVYYGANTAPLYGLVDVWCIPPRRSDAIAKRLAAGDEYWFVNSSIIWNVDEIDYFKGRRDYWAMWGLGYTGQLLWSVVNWEADPPAFNTLGGNGAAVLLYPVPGGLTTTIGWENLRDGLEDYDYLAVLKKRAMAPNAPSDLAKQARRLCGDPDLGKRVPDATALETVRREIGELIEKLPETDE